MENFVVLNIEEYEKLKRVAEDKEKEIEYLEEENRRYKSGEFYTELVEKLKNEDGFLMLANINHTFKGINGNVISIVGREKVINMVKESKKKGWLW